MHHFETEGQTETTVAPPSPGELLVANKIKRWQPVPANTEDVVKVLTQIKAEMPVWATITELPDNAAFFEMQQPAIDDPQITAQGIAALEEVQFTLMQILHVMRVFKMIAL